MKKIIYSVLLLAYCCAGAAAAADKEAYLHFMNGMVMERRGNYDLALQEYRRTLAIDPESVFVYKQALNLALHIGKVEEAAQWAEYVVKADSATADNWVLYGNVRWAKGDLEGARAAYEKGVELDPAAHEGIYQLASLWSSRNPEKSIGYLAKYLELRPEDSAEVYYQMAVLHNMKNNAAGVEESLLKSKAADPYYPQPRYMLGDFYEARSATAAALAEYLELTELEPRNKDLYNHIGSIYTSPAAINLDEAEKYFLKTYALDKTDPVACYWLSIISEQRRDFPAAAAFLEGSAALKEDPDAALRLAYYYTQAGGYKRAIGLLEKAAMKWPDNTEIAYFLALGYDDTGKAKKAVGLLKGIISRNPDNAEARMQCAVISEREGDMATAEEHFRYLLAKKPDNANALNYLGYSLADRGLKLAEAQVFIEKAVALEPANGAFLDSLAWVRYKRGNNAGALEAIRKAVAAVHDDPVIWAHAGDIYSAAGSYAAAWTAWKYSWLLEEPAKRGKAAARLKELTGKLPAGSLPSLEQAYLKTFSPAGLEFSSFAKVEGKVRGKTVKFDAIVHFSPPGDFSLTVMGPLMVPLWKAKTSGGVMEMDEVALKDLDPGVFSYWASLITGELRGWFAGDHLPALAPDLDGSCYAAGPREVCLDKALAWPEQIRNSAEKRLVFKPGNYFLRGLYLFPQTFEFKLPLVSLKVTLDGRQMNFEGVNTLNLPE
ncbi:MAG: tetratricopeptide repeat protein [Elusimicrobiales bacterium]